MPQWAAQRASQHLRSQAADSGAASGLSGLALNLRRLTCSRGWKRCTRPNGLLEEGTGDEASPAQVNC